MQCLYLKIFTPKKTCEDPSCTFNLKKEMYDYNYPIVIAPHANYFKVSDQYISHCGSQVEA